MRAVLAILALVASFPAIAGEMTCRGTDLQEAPYTLVIRDADAELLLGGSTGFKHFNCEWRSEDFYCDSFSRHSNAVAYITMKKSTDGAWRGFSGITGPDGEEPGYMIVFRDCAGSIGN